jgi:short-subunit dehydrogenase
MASNTGRPRALVTGASSGLGMAYAERLAQDGYNLILVARRRDRLEDLAARLKRSSVEADVVVADLTDTKGLSAVEARAASDEGITLLINNAGFAGYQPFAGIDTKVIDELIAIHVTAVARLSRAALPGMIRRGKGGIINIASLLSMTGAIPPNPLPHRATYAGAKAFMVTFTQALAGEIKDTGVRVQVCLPGRVATDFLAGHHIDKSKLPPEMSAQDVVTASLVALAQNEVVCIPGLGDPALLAKLTEAQITMFRASAMQSVIADRYRAVAAS